MIDYFNETGDFVVAIVRLGDEMVRVDMETKEVVAFRHVCDINPLAVQMTGIQVSTVGGYSLGRGAPVPRDRYKCGNGPN